MKTTWDHLPIVFNGNPHHSAQCELRRIFSDRFIRSAICIAAKKSDTSIEIGLICVQDHGEYRCNPRASPSISAADSAMHFTQLV